MNLSKIHHIAIIVSDYEAAKDFYVNKLGFSVIRENYRPERKDWKLDLRVNEHTELEIFAEKILEACEPSGSMWAAASCFLCRERGADGERAGKIRYRMCESIRVDDYTGKKMTLFMTRWSAAGAARIIMGEKRAYKARKPGGGRKS